MRAYKSSKTITSTRRPLPPTLVLAAMVSTFATTLACRADQRLFDCSNPDDLKRVVSTGANVTQTPGPPPRLRVP